MKKINLEKFCKLLIKIDKIQEQMDLFLSTKIFQYFDNMVINLDIISFLLEIES